MAYPNPSVLQQTQQQRVTNLLQTQAPLERVAYVGQTTNATPTELFLGGVADQRLQPPEDSVLIAQFTAIGREDVADKNAAHFIGRSAFSVIRYGTTLEVEGTNAFIDVATTGNPATQAVIGTAGHVAFTVDNTNDWMVLTVTGLAATTINWCVQLDSYLCLPYPTVQYKAQY
jgi:hypothetical protein